MSVVSDELFVSEKEVSLFPADLLDEPNDRWPDRRWWVLNTGPRQEKAVARSLRGFEVPFYLPLVEKTTVYRRSKFTSRSPFFTGYVFMCGSEEERVRSLTTNRVSRILTVVEPEQLHKDLQGISRLIASGAPFAVESRFSPGKSVRIRRGNLAGLEGTVLTRRGKTRLVVSVNFLQKGASIEIDDFMLEPI